MERTIKEIGKNLGFQDIKICDADELKSYQNFYDDFIQKNYHGNMDFLEKHEFLKTNPKKIVPEAKSIILVTLNYFQARKDAKNWSPKIHIPTHKDGQIARYAFGRDYHKVFKNKLKQFSKTLEENYLNYNARFFADSGPLLERQYAEKSGLGYIGKNTMLITQKYGSWVLIGEIITNIKLQADKPFDRKKMVCGSCNKCQIACPTGALYEDYKINASKCISYLTIEHKGTIPLELREKIGSWLFGCDICQEVCPHNFRSQETTVNDFKNAIAGEKQILKKILTIKDDEEFLNLFAGSPLMRGKRTNLIRNACIVAANLKRFDLIKEIQKLSESTNEIIKEHAQWALSKLYKEKF